VNLPNALSMVIVIFCLCLQAAAKTPHLPESMRTTHFIVRYDPSDPYLAKLTAEAAEDKLIKISRDLGVSLDRKRPFRLLVYANHMEFIEAGGLEEKKFTVGTATSWNDTISVDASGAFAPIEEVLAHEITHAVIFRALGNQISKLPLWLNEGLAKYQSEGLTYEDKEMVANAAANGTLIPLNNLMQRFPSDRIALAYAQSASAVDYLVREYGKSAPRRLLAELARSGSANKAMMKVTGKTINQFAADWYSATTAKYWTVRLTRIVSAVVSAAMAILAIAAFLVKRKQKIEAARRWEQEEFEEMLRKQLDNGWPR
jgi:hypothetical protein